MKILLENEALKLSIYSLILFMVVAPLVHAFLLLSDESIVVSADCLRLAPVEVEVVIFDGNVPELDPTAEVGKGGEIGTTDEEGNIEGGVSLSWFSSSSSSSSSVDASSSCCNVLLAALYVPCDGW